MLCVSPLCGPPLRWWVLCGALPSMLVPCAGPLCGPVRVPCVGPLCVGPLCVSPVWVPRCAASCCIYSRDASRSLTRSRLWYLWSETIAQLRFLWRRGINTQATYLALQDAQYSALQRAPPLGDVSHLRVADLCGDPRCADPAVRKALNKLRYSACLNFGSASGLCGQEGVAASPFAAEHVAASSAAPAGQVAAASPAAGLCSQEGVVVAAGPVAAGNANFASVLAVPAVVGAGAAAVLGDAAAASAPELGDAVAGLCSQSSQLDLWLRPAQLDLWLRLALPLLACAA